MSPEKAKIFMIDDARVLVDARKDYLEMDGHTVALVAHTKADAIDKINNLKYSEIDVIILDGNLSAHDDSGFDGRQLAKLIKEKHPDIKIIGSSGAGDIEGVDVNSEKIDGIVALEEIIRKI